MNRAPYRAPLPFDGWWRRPSLRRYMLRELSCIAFAAYAALLIVGLLRLSDGEAAWLAFRAALATPAALALQCVALAFALLHSSTWFLLAPRTLPLQIGARRVPGGWIAAAHFTVWIAVTLVVLHAVGV